MSLSVRRRFCGNCPKGLTYIVAESYPNCNRILRYFQKIVIIRECPASVAKKRRYSRYSPYMLANALKCSRIRPNAHFFAAWNGTAESKKRIGKAHCSFATAGKRKAAKTPPRRCSKEHSKCGRRCGGIERADGDEEHTKDSAISAHRQSRARATD